MKPNDKAYQAALEEGKLWCEGMQLNSPNPAVWKLLRVTNKNGNYKTIKKFNTREERDEALERLRAEAMIKAAYAAQFKSSESKALKKAWICYSLCEGGGAYDGPFFVKYEPEEGEYDKIEPILYYDAAYAAQFQSEEYAGLIEELRLFGEGKAINDAADALEALLAERDALNFELAARKEWPQARAEMLEELAKVRAERDALAARLAPVDDKALVEIAAREIAFAQGDVESPNSEFMDENWHCWEPEARAAIAAIRPHIEAAERERCARIVELDCDRHSTYAIAAAIRRKV